MHQNKKIETDIETTLLLFLKDKKSNFQEGSMPNPINNIVPSFKFKKV